jgi:hypothetical protein
MTNYTIQNKSSLTSFSALIFWIVKAIQLAWDFVKNLGIKKN